MGTNIGPIPASLSAQTQAATSARQPRTGEEGSPALGQRTPEEQPVRAGFGENTLSPGGAALQALDANLREARRVVPSVEELRETFRERRAEAEAVTEARVGARETARAETRPLPEEDMPAEQLTRPEPAPQARTFAERENSTPPTTNSAEQSRRLDLSG